MKKIYFVYTPLLLVSILLYGFSGDDLRYPDGAPAGYTGSPADGKNCTHCHNGSLANVEGWITTSIPDSGYAPGFTYDVTVSVPGSGEKGFELSPQTINGDLQGTLIAGSGSKLVGDQKYITHNSGVSGNPAVWTFQWTAPEEGTGDVVFYGAFSIRENQTKLSSLLIHEDITTSIPEEGMTQFSVYPNPVKDQLWMNYRLQNTEKVSVQLYSLNGNMISSFLDETQAAGQHRFTIAPKGVEAGLYLVVFRAGDRQIVQKMLF